MLLFRSEEHVDRWCRSRALPKRPLVSMTQLWELSVAWYANRITEDSRRPMGDEVRQIFDRVGLTGPFWEIPG
jgi:hypothetical protein